MALEDTLEEWKAKEAASDPTTAKWYLVAASAMAAASCGADSVKLYRLATKGLDLKSELLVQRRIKEAILKESALFGVPRCLQALFPLFHSLDDDHIDNYSPRYDSLSDPSAQRLREEKGRKYFDVIWTPELAEKNRQINMKHSPDLTLLTLNHVYEWYFSETSILSAIETQLCNAAALICSNCPTQAMWHTRGIMRHGGSMDDAWFAQRFALDIAKLYGCKTGDIIPVDEIPMDDKKAL